VVTYEMKLFQNYFSLRLHNCRTASQATWKALSNNVTHVSRLPTN